MAKEVEVGKFYQITLRSLIELYNAGKYTIEKNLCDEKGRPFICYVCLKHISGEHIYFCIPNKRLNMITEIRTHKECIESLI